MNLLETKINVPQSCNKHSLRKYNTHLVQDHNQMRLTKRFKMMKRSEKLLRMKLAKDLCKNYDPMGPKTKIENETFKKIELDFIM